MFAALLSHEATGTRDWYASWAGTNDPWSRSLWLDVMDQRKAARLRRAAPRTP